MPAFERDVKLYKGAVYLFQVYVLTRFVDEPNIGIRVDLEGPSYKTVGRLSVRSFYCLTCLRFFTPRNM